MWMLVLGVEAAGAVCTVVSVPAMLWARSTECSADSLLSAPSWLLLWRCGWPATVCALEWASDLL